MAVDSIGQRNTLTNAQAEGVLQMKQRPRIYYSDSQKALMWERWKQGWTLHEIGKLFDRSHSSIHGIFAPTGGIRPPERSRALTALTLAEREEISRALVTGESIRSIATRLGRAPSTISREIKRNGGADAYRANRADEAAWGRARRPKRCKLLENRALARIVADKLRILWAPEQIAGWLKHTYPCDESYHVSHETIYRSLFIQARGALKKELLAHLRRTRGMRRSRYYTQKTAIHGQIADTVSIRERPACVEDRAVPGHWEGDLVIGSANSQIATLVERQTRYVMLVKLNAKDSQTVVNALVKNARKLPQELYKSLTWDRGTEMHAHKQFTMATDIQIYFCDPQ
jgi:IS30 family transposase